MLKRSDEILVGAEEVAAFFGWHLHTLQRYAAKYPPRGAGLPAHLNGRWHWKKADAIAWRDYLIRQENRHPDARRFRPEEPPEVAAIRYSSAPEIETRASKGEKDPAR